MAGPGGGLQGTAAVPDRGAGPDRLDLGTLVAQWLRLGCLGFGGPPAHIAMVRRLCVERRGWISADEFEHAVATANLLPGPASTQLIMWCAWRLRRTLGAVVGGLCFIVPGLAVILALSALFLSSHAPGWVYGAAAGAGAAVPAVALRAAADLALPSWRLAGSDRWRRLRWVLYAGAGAAVAATAGELVVVVLLGCGLVEFGLALRRQPPSGLASVALPLLALGVVSTGAGIGALAWVAIKVGALSWGGGFVIIPLMQADAVHHYHWMSGPQFLDAVALGQLTPGPVVQTVAVVGYAEGGVAGGLFASAVAFAPSFLLVCAGAPRFERWRGSEKTRAFLAGAGPAAIGAIAGAAIPLGLALAHLWQVGLLAVAALALLVLRRSPLLVLASAGVLGVIGHLAGLPAPR